MSISTDLSKDFIQIQIDRKLRLEDLLISINKNPKKIEFIYSYIQSR